MKPKRGQNEGSIYKRKDGLHSAQVTGDDGKRVTKYFKTRKEAYEWLLMTNTQIKNGLSLSGAQAFMSEFLDNWLNTAKSSIRPKTYEQYRQIVNQHILPTIGKVRLKDLRPDMIQALYNNKLAQGVSKRTVKMIHSVIHRALNEAMKWGLTGRNPADAVSKPKLDRKEMKVLSDVQARTLLLTARGTRFEALFQLAITTGLREGEILGLKWTDLDWNTRRLQVQRQAQRQKGKGIIFSEPKTAAGRRVVVLGSSTIDKFRDHMKLLEVERQFAAENWQENDLIFPSVVGTPLDQRNLNKAYKVFLSMAGLPDIRFHDLRHTAASLMLQQGVHPKVVQERLGHSDISLTLNTYSHVLQGMQEDAAEKIDGLLTLIDVHEKIKQ